MSASDFDTGDLSRACREAGILFDPKGEVAPDQIYVQIVRPGIIRLPKEFHPEVIGRFGNLTVVMPPPEFLAAAKLVRGNEVDIYDVVWWVRYRDLGAADIQGAIERLPNEKDRVAARENLTFVQLVMGRT